MRSTLPKQLLYGLGYLILFIGIGYLVYLGFFKAAPTCADGILNQDETDIDCGGTSCIACDILRLKPIASSALILGSGADAPVLITLTNPNATYGAEHVTYTVDLLGVDGQIVGTFSRETFLYPAEIRHILETDFDTTGAVRVQVGAAVAKEAWRTLAAFPLPKVSVRELTIASQGANFTVSGVVRNENSFALSHMTLVGVVRSAEGAAPQAASKTLVQDVIPFSERFFSITFPQSGPLPPPALVDVFVQAER